jgi:hypothetical protein
MIIGLSRLDLGEIGSVLEPGVWEKCEVWRPEVGNDTAFFTSRGAP